MIKTLVFTKPHRGFKEFEFFDFRMGVNLLVGDQGCGKSTILEAMVAHAKGSKGFWKRSEDTKRATVLDFDPTSGVKGLFAHDFENDNPRTAPAIDLIGQVPMDVGLQCLWKSHGQVGNTVIGLIKEVSNAVIILDEPDAGLSPRSIRALIEVFKGMADRGCQVLASAHNPWVIGAFPEVLSIEHRRWMPSQEFLLSAEAPRDP